MRVMQRPLVMIISSLVYAIISSSLSLDKRHEVWVQGTRRTFVSKSSRGNRPSPHPFASRSNRCRSLARYSLSRALACSRASVSPTSGEAPVGCTAQSALAGQTPHTSPLRCSRKSLRAIKTSDVTECSIGRVGAEEEAAAVLLRRPGKAAPRLEPCASGANSALSPLPTATLCRPRGLASGLPPAGLCIHAGHRRRPARAHRRLHLCCGSAARPPATRCVAQATSYK